MADQKLSELGLPPGGILPDDVLYVVRLFDSAPDEFYQALVSDLKTPEVWMFALSDEDTGIIEKIAAITVRAPFAATLTGLRASVSTASISGPITLDVNIGIGSGPASILSTKLTIDQDELTSLDGAVPVVIADPNIDDDASITVDIDTAGAGAVGLKITFLVTATS